MPNPISDAIRTIAAVEIVPKCRPNHTVIRIGTQIFKALLGQLIQAENFIKRPLVLPFNVKISLAFAKSVTSGKVVKISQQLEDYAVAVIAGNELWVQRRTGVAKPRAAERQQAVGVRCPRTLAPAM